jgi:site-specific recombinase XerD
MAGTWTFTSERAMEELLADYSDYLEASGLSASTVKSYVADLKDLSSWLTKSGKGPLVSSTEDDIRAYCRHLVTAKEHPAATVNRRLQAMRKFFRYAMDRGLVEKDPCVGLKLLPQVRTDGRRGLEPGEVERLLEAVRRGGSRLRKRDYAVIQLMLQTGIRVGELTRLRLSDVKLLEDRGSLRVRAEGSFDEREVPLNSSVRKALASYLAERPLSDRKHLFLSIKGEPLSARSVQRLVSTYAEAAGLKDVSTYTLRQTFGQQLLRDTGDLSAVAKLMGHKRLESAVKYILPGEEDLTDVAEKSSLNTY